MPRSEGGSTTDQPTTNQPTETERIMEQRQGERGGASPTTKTYTVKSGDTLSDIAQSEMGDANRWRELYAANKDAVGDNPLACRLAGVRVWQVLLVVYVLCAILAAIGGVLYVGLTNAADLQLATPYLLPSVAAVVIGGTSIFGGVGGYAGTIMGAIILVVLDSLLTLLDASQAVKQILYGAIILLLAWLYATSTKRV
mgnify:CR=1 FL=1